MSHDVEDIITVVAGRPSVVNEIVQAPARLRHFVAQHTRAFLGREDAQDAIEDALPDARLAPGIVQRVRARLTAVAEIEQEAQ